MGRIPETELERLKETVSLVRLAEARGIRLSGQGDNLLGLCPFHDDRSPSLVISPRKNVWHCLGACQAGGSVIDWVMRSERVSFRLAVELLRKEAPSLVASSSPPGTRAKLEAVASPEEPDAVVLRRVVLEEYPNTLRQTTEAQDYLARRGLRDAELVEHFKLGHSNRTLGYRLPSGQVSAGAALREQMQRIGLYRASGHEHFAGSLTIPVLGEDGEVLEVYGRKLRDNLRKGTPLHLYLPSRGDGRRGVFNLEAFRASRELVLCEALIDALTFWAGGHRNVTSAYGVEGFTAELRDALIEHETKRLLIAYDADEAGDRAAEKLGGELGKEGIEVFRVRFPRGMDANEYALKVQPAAKALEAAIRGAKWMAGPRPVAVTDAIEDEAVEAPSVSRSIEVEPAGALHASPSTALTQGPNEVPELLKSMASTASEAVPPLAASSASSANVGASSEPLSMPSPEASAEVLPPSAMPVAETSLSLVADSAATVHESTPLDAEVEDDQVKIRLGDRRWRVRGLSKNTSYDALRVNLLVARGDAFYVDTLELYSARHRAVYLKEAARELKVEEQVLKGDVSKIILRLEDLVHRRIEAAVTPTGRPEMTSAAQGAALELLKDPRLLDRILEDFEGAGIVGEETNKLIGYLAAVSRKLESPLAVVIQSSSAAGKSSLMDAVLRFMPQEERVQYSAMTGQSHFYMGETDLAHKILAIAEEQGAQSASYALKLLQSEGELTIASTGKDPESGKLVTHNYRVKGPVMLFLTTTAIEVDEELLNRCLVLTVDEGAAQTGAIHARQREAQTLEGLLKKQTREARLELHQNAQRLLEPLAVVNPLAKTLRFSTAATRARRDHMKYLNLIQSVALLHQHQREIKTVEHLGKRVRYIEVTEGDVAVADRLANEVLFGGVDELPPQTRRLLEAIRTMVAEMASKDGVEASAVRFSRRDVREYTRWGDTALKKHLGRLEDLEHLLVHAGGARRRMTYALASRGYDGELVTPSAPWSPSGHRLGTGGESPDNSTSVQENLELVTLSEKTLPRSASNGARRVGIASYPREIDGSAALDRSAN